MKEPKWLKHKVVSHVHNLLLAEHGGPGGTRDDSLLKSALDRPKNKFGYETKCTLHDLAAAHTFGIAKNHPFVDGNKRAAFVCGALFLELNDVNVTASEADTVVTMEAVASGKMDELPRLGVFTFILGAIVQCTRLKSIYQGWQEVEAQNEINTSHLQRLRAHLRLIFVDCILRIPPT